MSEIREKLKERGWSGSKASWKIHFLLHVILGLRRTELVRRIFERTKVIKRKERRKERRGWLRRIRTRSRDSPKVKLRRKSYVVKVMKDSFRDVRFTDIFIKIDVHASVNGFVGFYSKNITRIKAECGSLRELIDFENLRNAKRLIGETI